MTALSRRSFSGVVAVVLFSGFAGQAVGQGLPAPALTATTAYVAKQIRPGIFQYDIGATATVSNWPPDTTVVVNVEVWKKAPNGLFSPIASGQMGGGNGPAGSPTYQPSFTGTIYPATGQSSGTYYCIVKATFYDNNGQGSPTTTVQTASVVIP